MPTFVAVCLGIIAAVQLATLIIWLVTALHLRRAAQAIEVLAYRAQDQMARLGDAGEKVRDFASSFRSVWLRAFAAALEAVAAFWARRSGGEKVHTTDGG